MASVFYETMGINYVLPVAECDLNISSKQQYGIISGIWFAGELCKVQTKNLYAKLLSLKKPNLSPTRHNLDIACVGILERHLWKKKSSHHCRSVGVRCFRSFELGSKLVAAGFVQTSQRTLVGFKKH